MNVHRSVWRRFCCFLTFFFEIKQPADFFVTLSRDPLPVGTWMSSALAMGRSTEAEFSNYSFGYSGYKKSSSQLSVYFVSG